MTSQSKWVPGGDYGLTHPGGRIYSFVLIYTLILRTIHTRIKSITMSCQSNTFIGINQFVTHHLMYSLNHKMQLWAKSCTHFRKIKVLLYLPGSLNSLNSHKEKKKKQPDKIKARSLIFERATYFSFHSTVLTPWTISPKTLFSSCIFSTAKRSQRILLFDCSLSLELSEATKIYQKEHWAVGGTGVWTLTWRS